MKQYLLPRRRNKSRKNMGEKAQKTWYGGYYENGRTVWFSLKTKNEEVAMTWFRKMQASLYAPETQQQVAKISIKEASEKFLADVEKLRKRESGTVHEYARRLKILVKYFGENTDMGSLNTHRCSEFVQNTFGEYSALTARNRLVMYRSFWNWASDRYNLAGKNPFKGIATQKPKSAPRKFWTVEECEKIISAAESEELKCYFALMAFAGLRKEEARHLRLENIKGSSIELVGKGGKFARIPISKRLKGYLDKYILFSLSPDCAGPLFPKLSKSASIYEYYLVKAVEKAGLPIEDAYYHRFRHSFASNLLRAGRSIKAVQLLMRHENVTLTLNIYGHLLPSDLEEAAEL